MPGAWARNCSPNYASNAEPLKAKADQPARMTIRQPTRSRAAVPSAISADGTAATRTKPAGQALETNLLAFFGLAAKLVSTYLPRRGAMTAALTSRQPPKTASSRSSTRYWHSRPSAARVRSRRRTSPPRSPQQRCDLQALSQQGHDLAGGHGLGGPDPERRAGRGPRTGAAHPLDGLHAMFAAQGSGPQYATAGRSWPCWGKCLKIAPLLDQLAAAIPASDNY